MFFAYPNRLFGKMPDNHYNLVVQHIEVMK